MPSEEPVQTFSYEDRVLDMLDHGALIVPEQRLRAEEGDRIRVLLDDDGSEEGDDYFINLIVPLGADGDGVRKLVVVYAEVSRDHWGEQHGSLSDPFGPS